MSFLNIAFPTADAVPVAQMAISTVVGAARPLLGLGILATMAIVFKPLLTGMLRAALVMLKPKLTSEEKIAKRNLRNFLTIHRIASDFDATSPNLAAELRAMAGRS